MEELLLSCCVPSQSRLGWAEVMMTTSSLVMEWPRVIRRMMSSTARAYGKLVSERSSVSSL